MSDVFSGSRVFIGSSRETLKIARGIKANLEEVAEVLVWNEDVFEPGRYTLDELLRFTHAFDFAVFVWSGDDSVVSRKESFLLPRDNVILEAGIFYGALGKDRVFLLVPRDDNLEVPLKVPTDLLGLTLISYRNPTHDNYRAAVSSACDQIKDLIQRGGKSPERESVSNNKLPLPVCYTNLEEAKPAIKAACQTSRDIKILSNKGLVFFGLDESVISLAEIKNFNNLRKLRMILLDPDSRWVNRSLMALRHYESVESFKKELLSSHSIVESSFKRFADQLKLHKSGVKYHSGEPYFRAVISDQVAFVSSYAEHPSVPVQQVRDLPVFGYENVPGSLYGSLKRHFNDLWHNGSRMGSYLQETIEPQVSAGGILIGQANGRLYVALAMRDDGSWVIPKGHREKKDESLEATAIREVAEELGLDNRNIKIVKQLDEYSHDETAEKYNISKIVYLFLLNYAGNALPELKSDSDHPAAKWWRLDQQLPFMFYTHQRILLSQVMETEYGIVVDIPK